jgi:hypothetical protein
MEILIVGIIVVALMAWGSTRIKRTAAAAFGAETIETDEFILKKPDGWLSIIEPREPYMFEGYTRDFGPPPDENIRLGTAQIEVKKGNIDEIAALIAKGGQIEDDIREVINDRRYRVLKLTRSVDDLNRLEWVKLGEADGRVYTLSVRILADTTADQAKHIEGMVDSFEIK